MITEIIRQANQRLKSLEKDFDRWKSHYKDLSEYLMPRKGRFIDRDTVGNDGDERNDKIINNAAGRAINTSAAGIYSSLTNPSVNWFKLGLEDTDLSEYDPVREWLEDVRKKMNWMLNKSNFYTAAYVSYKELLAFGTACMLAEEDWLTFARFYQFTIGQYYLATGQDQRVDTLYRIFKMTTNQMVRRFGKDNVCPSIMEQYEKRNSEEWHNVVHIIEPNDGTIKLPWTDKDYRSLYYEYESKTDKLLRKSGYDDFPVMAPRWDVTAEEVYGRSPGMDVLGDVKMLQKMEDKKLRALDKQVDPPLNAPAGMKKKAITSIPGSVNFVPDGVNTDTLKATYEVRSSIQEIQASINNTVQEIREGLYYDLFRMISSINDTPQKTAYEIAKKHEEKLQSLGPVVERLQPEMLDGVIDRIFNIGVKRGLFPEPPPELQGMELKIEYISILHQAQKMVQTTTVEQVVGFIGNLSGVKPDIIDKLDADEAVDQYSDMVGVNPKIIRSDDEVKLIREARAKEEAAANQAAALQQMTEGAKTLSETDTGTNNALTQLFGGP